MEARTSTFCGTPEYMSPEILKGEEYGPSTDIWSLGTVLYEALTGLPPFYAEDVQSMYMKIIEAELQFPKDMDEDCKDLLSKMLAKSPKDRIDMAGIKAHPFFSRINWDSISNISQTKKTYDESNYFDESCRIRTLQEQRIYVSDFGTITLYSPFTSSLLFVLSDVPEEKRYEAYSKLKTSEDYSVNPSMYIEVGLLLLSHNSPLGLRVLSNIVEIELENPQMLRTVGYILMSNTSADYSDQILRIFKKVLKIRPEEPQSYRDLALNFIRIGLKNPSKQRKYFQKAIKLYNKILEKAWDIRFTQIEVIAISELNRLRNHLLHSENLQVHSLASHIDKRITFSIHMDIRVVIQWDTDLSDIELHVVEPNDEVCYVFNNKTSNGGLLSKDFTRGYGPEEYIIRNATRGVYQLFCYLRSAQNNRYGNTILVSIWLNYGNPTNEKEYFIVRRLEQLNTYQQICELHATN
eukprot:TRINITY_DN13585_c0_g4_i1.p1 TRINITY_DN13585_c0_g4~~TRINITY_DN13585_c0_g4_i1.p1  ORF type:complete len:508 (-),score=118.96 TRINITY_DN13585_c0_g4_i1:12-1406(-)